MDPRGPGNFSLQVTVLKPGPRRNPGKVREPRGDSDSANAARDSTKYQPGLRRSTRMLEQRQRTHSVSGEPASDL